MAKYNWRLHVEKDSSSTIETADIYSTTTELEDGQPYLRVNVPVSTGVDYNPNNCLKGYVQGTTDLYDDAALSAYVLPEDSDSPFRLKKFSGKQFVTTKLLYDTPGTHTLTLPPGITRFVAMGIGAGSSFQFASNKGAEYDTIKKGSRYDTPQTSVTYNGQSMEVPIEWKLDHLTPGEITGYKYNTQGYFDVENNLSKNSVEYYGTPSGVYNPTTKMYKHSSSGDFRAKIFNISETGDRTVTIQVAGISNYRNPLHGLTETININQKKQIDYIYPVQNTELNRNINEIVFNGETEYQPYVVKVWLIEAGAEGSRANFGTFNGDYDNFNFDIFMNLLSSDDIKRISTQRYKADTAVILGPGSTLKKYLSKGILKNSEAIDYEKSLIEQRGSLYSSVLVGRSDNLEIALGGLKPSSIPILLPDDSAQASSQYNNIPIPIPFADPSLAKQYFSTTNIDSIQRDEIPSHIRKILDEDPNIGRGINGVPVLQPFISSSTTGISTSEFILEGGRGGDIYQYGDNGKVSKFSYLNDDYTQTYYKSGSGGMGGIVSCKTVVLRNDVYDGHSVKVIFDPGVRNINGDKSTYTKEAETDPTMRWYYLRDAAVVEYGGELELSATKLMYPNTGAVSIVYGSNIESGNIPNYTWGIPNRSFAIQPTSTSAPLYTYRELQGILPFSPKRFYVSADLIGADDATYSTESATLWNKDLSAAILEYKNEAGVWTNFKTESRKITITKTEDNTAVIDVPLRIYSTQWRLSMPDTNPSSVLKSGISINSYEIYDE